MRSRKRAERTERYFRWSVYRYVIGQAGFFSRSTHAIVTVVELSLLNLPSLQKSSPFGIHVKGHATAARKSSRLCSQAKDAR